MKTAALIFTVLWSTAMAAQAQKPTSGYAPVNGLKMYYEIHGNGSGEPVVLLHGSFMTISINWTEWIGELSKTRKVIAVEMQGRGRTADINRDFSYENLTDDIAAMLDYLKPEGAFVQRGSDKGCPKLLLLPSSPVGRAGKRALSMLIPASRKATSWRSTYSRESNT